MMSRSGPRIPVWNTSFCAVIMCLSMWQLIRLSCVLMTWQFGKALVKQALCGMPTTGNHDCIFRIRVNLCCWEADPKGRVACSKVCIVNLPHHHCWPEHLLGALSPLQTPLPTACSLEGSHRLHPTPRRGLSICMNDLEFFCVEDLSSFPIFIPSSNHLRQDELNICCPLWVIIQY